MTKGVHPQKLKHKDCPRTGVRFLWIPGGRFEMGANVLCKDSKPAHWVRVSPFWLGETPVTNQQYEIFLKDTDHREPAFWREQFSMGERSPVVGVSWHDAVAFCAWLSKENKLRCCLPSEAQWEFAARGTENSDDNLAAFNRPHEHPTHVAFFPSGKGPFGTLGQAGNVWEWCRDVWDAKGYEKWADKEPIDPVGIDGDALIRTLRGGSCWVEVENLRCAYRYWSLAEFQHLDFGFRVAAESM